MNNHEKPLPDVVIADDLPPRIKQGIYELAFVDYQTAKMFKGKAHKLIMQFRITTFGDSFGLILPRYYNVQHIIGNPQRHGRFKASKKGDFVREYLTLFPSRADRLDRIPMTPFQDVIIQGKVETVTFSRGKEIPKPLQYSKVAELRQVVS